jgi:hypothetical protein
MSEKNKIKCLEDHTRKLEEEIRSINLKNSKLSAEDYLREKTKLETLKNLLAIARNELNSHLHHYKFTLTGEMIGAKGVIAQKIVRNRLFSDINCNAKVPSTLKTHVKSTRPLIDIIQRDYSSMFVDGKFEIKRLKQLR